jgi:hypothetical protein
MTFLWDKKERRPLFEVFKRSFEQEQMRDFLPSQFVEVPRRARRSLCHAELVVAQRCVPDFVRV